MKLFYLVACILAVQLYEIDEQAEITIIWLDNKTTIIKGPPFIQGWGSLQGTSKAFLRSLMNSALNVTAEETTESPRFRVEIEIEPGNFF